MHDYMVTLERKFSPDGLWEVFIQAERDKRRNRFYLLGRTNFAAFGLLTLAGLAIFCFTWFFAP
jgi:hypothetical protein